MERKELNSLLMDSFAVAERHFKRGGHYADMTLKQRREVLKNYHGKDLYTKLATMNLGATSSAARIMLLNLEGRTARR